MQVCYCFLVLTNPFFRSLAVLATLPCPCVAAAAAAAEAATAIGRGQTIIRFDGELAQMKRIPIPRKCDTSRVRPPMDARASAAGAACLPPPEQLVLVLVGAPGSGKSTLAALLLPDFHRISQDALGSRPKCLAAAEAAMQQGCCVVIDRCNFDAEQRSTWVRGRRSRSSCRSIRLIYFLR